MKTPISTKIFIDRAKNVHNSKYDYSLTRYTGIRNKIKIICQVHGLFEQRAGNHLNGANCPVCSLKNRIDKIRATKEEFIKKARKTHGDKYDYSLVNYINNSTKVIIICPVHGEFKQLPSSHCFKSGCEKCKNKKNSERSTMTIENFIKKSRKIHGDKYDYSKAIYKNTRSKIQIICPTHGKFFQVAASHLNGKGCKKCNTSKGEKRIGDYLQTKQIPFLSEKTFDTCINPKTGFKLRFDFYLPDCNLLIEYDGEIHFFKRSIFKKKFIETVYRDRIKNKWCKNNNVRLLRIPFTKFDKIEEILEKEL